MIALLQYVGMILIWPFLAVFTDLQINGRERLRDVRGPLIVTANHESHLDPILVGIGLFSQPNIFPLRFMAKNEFFSIPFFNVLIWALGSYRSRKGEGLHRSLEIPHRILEHKGTVMMFPEGKIIPERGQLGIGRRGAAGLAILSKSGILPITVHTPANFSLGKFFFAPRHTKKIRINVGEVFYLNNVEFPDISDTVTSRATVMVMKRLHELYRNHTYDPSDLPMPKEDKKTAPVVTR